MDTTEVFNSTEEHTNKRTNLGLAKITTVDIEESLRNISSELTAGGNLNINVTNDFLSKGTTFDVGDKINISAEEVYLLNAKDYEYKYSYRKKERFAVENFLGETVTALVVAGLAVGAAVLFEVASFGTASPLAAGLVAGGVGGAAGAIHNAATDGSKKGTITTSEKYDEKLQANQFNANEINIESRNDILLESRTEFNADNKNVTAGGEILEHKQSELHTDTGVVKKKFGKTFGASIGSGLVIGTIVASVAIAVERTYCALDPSSCATPETEPFQPLPQEETKEEPDNTGEENETEEAEKKETLGKLSEKRESGGKGPGTVNAYKDANGNYVLNIPDDKGGFSYGVWQIASKTGSMDAFMNLLKKDYPDYYNVLTAAGGVEGAKAGTNEFIDAWQDLARKNPVGFRQAQYEFIYDTHYLKRINFVYKNYSMLDIDNRNPIIKDVIWSMSVQHVGTERIITNALKDQPLALLSDEMIIKMLYEERTNYVQNLKDMSDKGKAELTARYIKEMKDALDALK